MTVISLVPLRIDAAADDVARDGHRILERARVAARLGRGQHDAGARRRRATSQSRLPVSADRLGQRAHPLDRGVELGRVADHEAQPPAGGRNIADLDPRLAAAKLGGDLPLPSACSRCLAASAVSASSSSWLPPAMSRPRLIRALGQPAGQLRRPGPSAAGSGSRAGCRRGSVSADRPDLPAREIEHQSLAGLAGRDRPTWVSVDLTAVTRTPWPSSTSTSVSVTLVTLPISRRR